jgi:hypothetical protein
MVTYNDIERLKLRPKKQPKRLLAMSRLKTVSPSPWTSRNERLIIRQSSESLRRIIPKVGLFLKLLSVE